MKTNAENVAAFRDRKEKQGLGELRNLWVNKKRHLRLKRAITRFIEQSGEAKLINLIEADIKGL